MRRSVKSLIALAGATVLSATFAAPALAVDDNLNDQLVTGNSTTFTAGGSSALNYYIQANGSSCDASPAAPINVSIAPPAGLSASPSSLSFTKCKDGSTLNAQTVTFSSSTPGTYSVTPAVSGGAPAGGHGLSATTTTFTVTAPPDTTPPVITPSVSGTAGTNGWYVSNVTVSWTVTDAQSTVTSSSGCGTTTLTTETTGTDVTCSATSAGGTSSVTRTIKLDKTGPSASLSPAGTAGSNGWFISDVAVTTSGTDTISGPVACTAVQNLTAETMGQTVNGSCTNDAGLSTNATALTVKIDKTAPTAVSSAVSGTLGANGWYTSDVTVTTTGTETVSGPATCSGPVTLTSSTTSAGTNVTGSCTNSAGLSASAAPLNVKIDKSKPSATLSAAGTLGTNGWYVSDVTVMTSGSDADSGATCTADQHLTTDTTVDGQDFNGSCTNGAGLTQDATTLNVKRDASAPTATLVVTAGTPGANGWYTSNVTVQAQGVDAQSGVTCSGGGPATADTTGIIFTGYCVNGAGIRTDAAPLTIKLDKTGPSATLVVTAGTEGLNGWYTSDVTVSTSGTDSVSSPVICTANQSQNTETTGQVFNGSCTNDAGLSTDAAALTVKLDKTGPTGVVSAVTTGTPGANGWYTSDVVVSTTGSEDISGPAGCTGKVTLQDETTGTEAAGSCTNQAGLPTAAPSLVIKIDKTAPVVSVDVTGTHGAHGWFVTDDVTVTTSGTDLISSPVSCDDPQTVAGDTAGQVMTGSCTNDAGLSASSSVTVKLDKTAPSAALSVTAGTPGADGWYTSDATVSTYGSDDVSGPVTCTAGQFQTNETTGAVFQGSCTNDAGLSTDADPLTVKLDKTGPTAALAVTAGTLGTNGWYTSDVTVSTLGADSISGVTSCSGDQHQTTETGGQVFTGSCTNGAGLTTDADPFTVKVDKTGPSATSIVSVGTPGSDGWYTSDVTVSTFGSDAVSSPVTCTADQSQTTETTGQVFNGSCTNDAGLTTDAAPLTVKLDTTAPTVTVTPSGTPGNNGWYVSPVTLSTSGSESVSSPVTGCTADQTQTADTAGAIFTGSCSNDAGLIGTASVTIKVDRTAPSTPTFVGSPVSGGTYYPTTVPAAPTCASSDALSGLTIAGCVVTGYSTAVGSHTLTATATDNAGNTSYAYLSYTVYTLTYTGFFAPVDLNPTVNTVKAGSTVPLKFRVFDQGVERTDTAVVASFGAKSYVCGTTAPEDAIEMTTTGGTSLRYDTTGSQFIQNWQTPKSGAGSCYLAKVAFVDGSSISAYFKLK